MAGFLLFLKAVADKVKLAEDRRLQLSATQETLRILNTKGQDTTWTEVRSTTNIIDSVSSVLNFSRTAADATTEEVIASSHVLFKAEGYWFRNTLVMVQSFSVNSLSIVVCFTEAVV